PLCFADHVVQRQRRPFVPVARPSAPVESAGLFAFRPPPHQLPSTTPMTDRKLHPETLAVRTQAPQTPAREPSVPLYLPSSFTFDSAEQARALFADEVPGNIYSRYSNPNSDEFVGKLCALEGAEEGIATGSGMAAVFVTLASLLGSGDHVLASR